MNYENDNNVSHKTCTKSCLTAKLTPNKKTNNILLNNISGIKTSTPKIKRIDEKLERDSKRRLRHDSDRILKRPKQEASISIPSTYSHLLNDCMDDLLRNASDEVLFAYSEVNQDLNDPNAAMSLHSMELFSGNESNVEVNEESHVDNENKQEKLKSPDKSNSSLDFHVKDKISPDDSFKSMSRLFMESDLSKEGNKSFSDSIREKLLKNISLTSEFSLVKHTGWTQIGEFSQGLNQNCGSFFGLPLKVKQLFDEIRGIKEFYEWQTECLNLKAIQTRKNLVYALPTSGGKTLVAEILILKEILCRNKSVLFVLPFVSIVQEKVRALAPFALSLGFLVEEYAAGKGCIPIKKRRRKNSVIIATIEKGLAIVESLIELGRLSELGLIVIDELHLLTEDSGRGATLESLLTYIMFSKEKIHLVGMSATIGNLNEVAQFLNADTFTGTFRPVSLSEFVKCGNKIYSVDWQNSELILQRTICGKPPDGDPDNISELVKEVVPADSILVFCSTKKNCENVALLLCKYLPASLQSYRQPEKSALITNMLIDSFNRICPILRQTIHFGVAYHHSGLTVDERRLIEEAFREGTLSVICCTSTLAAGVNLPAKRVILRAPYVGKDFICLSKYKQMVGRAGRAGFGANGESFLLCQPNDCQKVGELLRSKMDDVVSRMNEETCRSLVLSAIGLQVAVTREDLRNLLCHTLLYVQSNRLDVDVKRIIDRCITILYKQGAIKINNALAEDNESKLDFNVTRKEKRKKILITNSAELGVSRLGQAAIKGCMNLETALRLYSDLNKAQSNLVLLCNLHILYVVTPYEMADQVKPNYSVYFDIFTQLGSKELHAAHIIGLSEKVIMKLVTGQKPKQVSDFILNRFYLTLILNEMWKQQGIWDVANLFQVQRGFVQTLMSQAASFASNVLRYCDSLEEFWGFKAILTEFVPRLTYCCEPELIPLMELPAVKKARAKQFVKAGFKTLQSIIQADPKTLVSAIENLPMKAAKQIIEAAKLQIFEKAENLKEEAEDILEGVINNITTDHLAK